MPLTAHNMALESFRRYRQFPQILAGQNGAAEPLQVARSADSYGERLAEGTGKVRRGSGPPFFAARVTRLTNLAAAPARRTHLTYKVRARTL